VRRLLALAVAGACGLACTESEPQAIVDIESVQPCSEPCQTSVDCPSGSSCESRPDRDGGVVERACRTGAGTFDPAALTHGFGVGSFTLTPNQVEAGPLQFSWRRPTGARIVTCALFVCPPEFWPSDRVATGPDGEPWQRIHNASKCIIATRSFEPAEGPLVVATMEPGPPRPPPDSCLEGPHDGSPVSHDPGPPSSLRVTIPSVGCWALDETHIIRATRLEHVLPRDFPPGLINFTEHCSEDTPYANCRVSIPSPFGACVRSECVPLCIANRDCLRAQQLLDQLDADAGTEVATSCQRCDGGAIGVCAEPDPAMPCPIEPGEP
jgi:hypothetical protein